MLPVALLLAGLPAGWRLSGLWSRSRQVRGLLTWSLAGALATSFYSLSSPLSDSRLRALAAVLALFGWWAALARAGQSSAQETGPQISRGILVLVPLLLSGGWLFAIGFHQLQDQTEAQRLCALPLGGFGQAWGVDPFLASQLLSGSLTLLVVLGTISIFLTLFPDSSAAAGVGSLFLLLGGPHGWLLFGEPQDALTHLWAVILLGGLRANPWTVAPMAAALLGWTPLLPLAYLLVLFPRYWGRGQNWLAVVSGVALHLSGPGPSLNLLAALLIVLGLSHSSDQRSLALARLGLLSPPTGLLALTALGVELALRWQRAWAESDVSNFEATRTELRVPRRLVLGGLFLVLFWRSFDPGESQFNDQILIAAQQGRYPLTQLFIPRARPDWIAWRQFQPGQVPDWCLQVERLTARVVSPTSVEVPASGLVPIQLELTNPTSQAVDLSQVIFLRARPHFELRPPLKSIEQPLTPWPGDSLEAGATRLVPATLRTGPTPLHYQLGFELVGPDSVCVPLNMASEFEVVSYPTGLQTDVPLAGKDR